ncbi:hypothetical protein [Bradyrhizobium sp. SZCCHNS2015]|uniref:hypothetical protein n=1 Tax=Bradyrhizobium sp. SZCCHNS2015 TaxID=3057305 RepID=UPI0028EF91D8|nr:hypothetical protein [Bradyrhizobium sp. SZCCHNS2015]
MPDLSPDEQRNENRLKQIHDYIRHTFQLFLTWFALFATINYVAFGWLVSPNSAANSSGAASAGNSSHVQAIALVVGVNFIIQNFLGIAAAIIVDRVVKDFATKASKLEGPDPIVPIALYRGAIFLVGIALFVTAAVWGIVIAVR